ncbi:MAG: DUF2958 domain-containing protein [Planctomycetota bacterium]
MRFRPSIAMGPSAVLISIDPEDLCFGLVDGHEVELGYFSFDEIESIRGPGGLKI